MIYLVAAIGLYILWQKPRWSWFGVFAAVVAAVEVVGLLAAEQAYSSLPAIREVAPPPLAPFSIVLSTVMPLALIGVAALLVWQGRKQMRR